jgi:protein TonB
MKILCCLVGIFSFLAGSAQTDTLGSSARDTTIIFQRVEIEAYFPGGTEQWKRFLEKKIKAQKVAKKAAPKNVTHWQQTANVRFMIEKDGSISNVSVTNASELHEEVVKECLRVFSKLPKWMPGTQNGKPVRSWHTQPLTFYLK